MFRFIIHWCFIAHPPGGTPDSLSTSPAWSVAGIVMTPKQESHKDGWWHQICFCYELRLSFNWAVTLSAHCSRRAAALSSVASPIICWALTCPIEQCFFFRQLKLVSLFFSKQRLLEMFIRLIWTASISRGQQGLAALLRPELGQSPHSEEKLKFEANHLCGSGGA